MTSEVLVWNIGSGSEELTDTPSPTSRDYILVSEGHPVDFKVRLPLEGYTYKLKVSAVLPLRKHATFRAQVECEGRVVRADHPTTDGDEQIVAVLSTKRVEPTLRGKPMRWTFDAPAGSKPASLHIRFRSTFDRRRTSLTGSRDGRSSEGMADFLSSVDSKGSFLSPRTPIARKRSRSIDARGKLLASSPRTPISFREVDGDISSRVVDGKDHTNRGVKVRCTLTATAQRFGNKRRGSTASAPKFGKGRTYPAIKLDVDEDGSDARVNIDRSSGSEEEGPSSPLPDVREANHVVWQEEGVKVTASAVEYTIGLSPGTYRLFGKPSKGTLRKIISNTRVVHLFWTAHPTHTYDKSYGIDTKGQTDTLKPFESVVEAEVQQSVFSDDTAAPPENNPHSTLSRRSGRSSLLSFSRGASSTISRDLKSKDFRQAKLDWENSNAIVKGTFRVVPIAQLAQSQSSFTLLERSAIRIMACLEYPGVSYVSLMLLRSSLHDELELSGDTVLEFHELRVTKKRQDMRVNLPSEGTFRVALSAIPTLRTQFGPVPIDQSVLATVSHFAGLKDEPLGVLSEHQKVLRQLDDPWRFNIIASQHPSHVLITLQTNGFYVRVSGRISHTNTHSPVLEYAKYILVAAGLVCFFSYVLQLLYLLLCFPLFEVNLFGYLTFTVTVRLIGLGILLVVIAVIHDELVILIRNRVRLERERARVLGSVMSEKKTPTELARTLFLRYLSNDRRAREASKL